MNTQIGSQSPQSSTAIAYGRSLPQAYYTDAAIFARDTEMLGRTQWFLVDHVSRIPKAGDYFLFDVGNENLIIVRDRSDRIQGFFNVCRHRGSRVCLESQGSARYFVCPYHAWTYDLDGRLRGAAAMPEGFDKSDHGLEPVHVRVHAGFIFLNLSPTAPPSFEAFVERLTPFLNLHRFEDAKVAVRKNYPTDANWKLVVENFLECYHCKPAHSTYCSVHNPEKLLAFGAGPGSASGELATRFHQELTEWEAQMANRGRLIAMFGDEPNTPWFQAASRLPIGEGYQSESVGGTPVAPLMGSFAEYDGAQTAVAFNPLSYIMASNDYAAVMRFTPRGPMKTDVETLWLVRAGAAESKDYDPSKLIHVWDVTLREDKTITENNQLGVLSSSYRPGPHSLHEKRISDFLAWYKRLMESPLN